MKIFVNGRAFSGKDTVVDMTLCVSAKRKSLQHCTRHTSNTKGDIRKSYADFSNGIEISGCEFVLLKREDDDVR